MTRGLLRNRTQPSLWPVAVLAAVLGAAPASRAEATAEPVTLLVLGSGGPRLSNRASVGNIVYVNGVARVLVDAGSGTFVRAGEAGVDISALDAVLLTHLHADHSAELAGFVKARGLDATGPVFLKVVGPSGNQRFPSTSALVEGLFGARGLYRYLRNFGAEMRVVGVDIPAKLGSPAKTLRLAPDLSVTAQAIHHGDTPAVAFRLEVAGRSLVYSGDVDASGLPSLAQLARGADLLVVSCAVLDPPESPEALYQRHSPPKLLGETAAKAAVGALLLTHLPPVVVDRQSEVLASVKQAYGGPVTFAADAMQVAVKASAR